MSKSKVTPIASATPIVDAVEVTSCTGDTFTINYPSSKPSGRALMACWLSLKKRVDLRQGAQAGTFTKLDCWRLTDDARKNAHNAKAFDRVVKRAIESGHGLTAQAVTVFTLPTQPAKPKASANSDRPTQAQTVKMLVASGLSAKVAKAMAQIMVPSK